MTRQRTFWIALIAVGLLLAAGLALGAVSGFRGAFDLSGGAIIRYENPAGVTQSDVAAALQKAGIEAQSILMGSSTQGGKITRADVLVQSRDQSGAFEALKAAYPTAQIGEPEPVATETPAEDGDETESEETTTPVVENLSEVETISAAYAPSTLVMCAVWIAVGLIAACVYMLIRFGWQASVSALVIALVDVCFAVGAVLCARIHLNMGIFPAALLIVAYSIANSAAFFNAFRGPRKQAKNADNWLEKGTAQSRFRLGVLGVFGAVLLAVVTILGYETIATFALPAVLGVAFGVFSNRCMTPALYGMLHK